MNAEEDSVADANVPSSQEQEHYSRRRLYFRSLELSRPAFPNSDQIVNLCNEANFAYIFVMKNLLHAIKMRTNYILEDRSPRS